MGKNMVQMLVRSVIFRLKNYRYTHDESRSDFIAIYLLNPTEYA